MIYHYCTNLNLNPELLSEKIPSQYKIYNPNMDSSGPERGFPAKRGINTTCYGSAVSVFIRNFARLEFTFTATSVFRLFCCNWAGRRPWRPYRKYADKCDLYHDGN